MTTRCFPRLPSTRSSGQEKDIALRALLKPGCPGNGLKICAEVCRRHGAVSVGFSDLMSIIYLKDQLCPNSLYPRYTVERSSGRTEVTRFVLTMCGEGPGGEVHNRVDSLRCDRFDCKSSDHRVSSTFLKSNICADASLTVKTVERGKGTEATKFVL